MHILFYILFYYGLSQGTEYGSLCYKVGSGHLSILHITAPANPTLPQSFPLLPPPPLGNHESVLYACESVSAL